MTAKRQSSEVRSLAIATDKAQQLAATLDQDDPKLIADMIEGSTDFNETVMTVADSLAHDEALANALQQRIDDMTERKRRFAARAATKRAAIQQAMEVLEQRQIVGDLATVSVTATPAKMVIDDESQIPSRFFKREPKLDRAKLREALDAGKTVTGAHLASKGATLQIRFK